MPAELILDRLLEQSERVDDSIIRAQQKSFERHCLRIARRDCEALVECG